jgi:hypothetical protein
MRHKSKRTWQLVILLGLALIIPLTSRADPLDDWTWVNPPPEQVHPLNCVAYGTGFFVGVIFDMIVTSPDGITWTQRVGSTGSLWTYGGLNAVSYGNGLFVAVGGTAVLTSPDGVTWTQRCSGAALALGAITRGNGLFVAAGYKTILTSPDGLTWTTQETPEGIPWEEAGGAKNWLQSVAYGNGTFVAVGDAGIVLSSPDGVAWTQRVSETTSSLWGVSYGNGTFVAAGSGIVLTSPDGATWTQRTTDHFSGVTYANGSFVAVGGSGMVATSPDGATWTQRTAVTTDDLLGVSYGNGTFVAVSWQGAIIQSSPASGINLSPGWNFISFPKQPANTAIEAVLSDPSSTPVIVWGYDNQAKAWKKWEPQGAANTLATMESGKGYWIYMNAAGTIDMTRWTLPPATVSIYNGWNLVGYAGTDNKHVPLALSTLPTNWSLVWNWEYSRWQAKHRTISALPGFDALDTFRQMKAYWIRVDGQDMEWNQ